MNYNFQFSIYIIHYINLILKNGDNSKNDKYY